MRFKCRISAKICSITGLDTRYRMEIRVKHVGISAKDIGAIASLHRGRARSVSFWKVTTENANEANVRWECRMTCTKTDWIATSRRIRTEQRGVQLNRLSTEGTMPITEPIVTDLAEPKSKQSSETTVPCQASRRSDATGSRSTNDGFTITLGASEPLFQS